MDAIASIMQDRLPQQTIDRLKEFQPTPDVDPQQTQKKELLALIAASPEHASDTIRAMFFGDRETWLNAALAAAGQPARDPSAE